jgi:hypothetical protein
MMLDGIRVVDAAHVKMAQATLARAAMIKGGR